jgi:nicotinate-nucleotide--dimethylbenzimidazole phosphoribosyltransferase
MPQIYLIKSAEIKRQLKICLQTMMKKQLHQHNEQQKQAYKALKLEAIEEAPLVIFDRSVLNNFTIGTVGSNEAIKFSAVCGTKYLAF